MGQDVELRCFMRSNLCGQMYPVITASSVEVLAKVPYVLSYNGDFLIGQFLALQTEQSLAEIKEAKKLNDLIDLISIYVLQGSKPYCNIQNEIIENVFSAFMTSLVC